MLVRRVFGLLRPKEKRSFIWVFLILGVSALLSQVLPLAVGYLTDDILVGDGVAFSRAVPVLLFILVTTIVNEVIKVIRRLLVERAATQAEKNGRTLAAGALLHAPMGYFRQNMTGNIHGRLNRSLEGVTRLVKLVSMDFAPAVFNGVAGPSGGGKSTLIKALDKLEPAEGKITVGGRDLAALSRKELAELVVLVPQRPFLIAGCVLENICYGMPGGVPLEAVREAARRASIASDIEKMPGGYEFRVAEGGHNLSGGQCQRIALARVFLRKPRILILDEATSALDNTSEKKIQGELEQLKAECGTTILSIAHRLTTLRNCDRIVVADQGKIVRSGTYDELLETPGLFQDMSAGVVH